MRFSSPALTPGGAEAAGGAPGKTARWAAKPAILPYRIEAGRRGRTVLPRQIITTANAPSSPLYSQAVKAGPQLLVLGIVGTDPGTGRLTGDTIHEQTRQALANCQAVVQAGGGSLDGVLEVGILLANAAGFAGLNGEYARWSRPNHRPATSPSSASTCPDCSSRSG